MKIRILLMGILMFLISSQGHAQTTYLNDTIVEEASFQNGTKGLIKFLTENVRYPDISRELTEQGKVFLEFVIEEDGSLSNVKVLRSVSELLDEEAIRVLKEMPKWIPAKDAQGNAIRSKVVIPINFVLIDDK